MIFSILLCALSGIIFTGWDVYGFGDKVQGGKWNLIPYRVTQTALQFGIYAALFFTHHYGALAGFAVTHWCMGYDYLYYVWRGEKYEGYLVTWFKIALPQLISNEVRGHYISGMELKWIGKVAIVLGLIISAAFA